MDHYLSSDIYTREPGKTDLNTKFPQVFSSVFYRYLYANVFSKYILRFEEKLLDVSFFKNALKSLLITENSPQKATIIYTDKKKYSSENNTSILKDRINIIFKDKTSQKSYYQLNKSIY